jgi:hypothetical protein
MAAEFTFGMRIYTVYLHKPDLIFSLNHVEKVVYNEKRGAEGWDQITKKTPNSKGRLFFKIVL